MSLAAALQDLAESGIDPREIDFDRRTYPVVDSEQTIRISQNETWYLWDYLENHLFWGSDLMRSDQTNFRFVLTVD